MFKKIISLLLAICILFCFAACGKTETNNSHIDDSSNSQMDELPSTDENDSSTDENDSSTDKTESSEDKTETTQSNNSQESSNTAQPEKPDPVQPTSPVTKPTHTHKYADANCTAPKTCSCGATQGSALGHNYQNGVCSRCNAIDEKKYVEAQVNAADKAFVDYTKYNDALKIIKEALQKFPQNYTLKLKRDYYQSFAPVYLSDMEPYSKTVWFELLDNDKDIFNTTHYHCVRIAKNFTTANATYDLSAKHNTFSAKIYGLGDGNSGSLKIYADGVCIYSNTSIDPNTRAFNIALDVTGVFDLKFEMEQDYNSYVGECFGLSDVYVQKTVK